MMLDRDMLQKIKNVKGIKAVAPCLQYKMYDDRFQLDISIAGIDTSSIATSTNVISRKFVIKGRYLSHNHEEILAEQSFAAAHGLSAGDTIAVFGSKLVIAGLVNAGIRPVKEVM